MLDTYHGNIADIKEKIEAFWNLDKEKRESTKDTDFLQECIKYLDQGVLRVCKQMNDQTWHTYEWLKRAIMLYMESKSCTLNQSNMSYDKMPLKFTSWSEKDFILQKIRVASGTTVRFGSYIGHNNIIMPSFINIGAYIGNDTLIDGNSHIGSCAQIGQRCHIGAGTTIGGVLAPTEATPVIIENDVFIGANCTIAGGVLVGQGSVLAAGTCITAGTKIYNRMTGSLSYSKIPSYSIVVPGSIRNEEKDYHALQAAIIVKNVNAKTRAALDVNDIWK